MNEHITNDSVKMPKDYFWIIFAENKQGERLYYSKQGDEEKFIFEGEGEITRYETEKSAMAICVDVHWTMTFYSPKIGIERRQMLSVSDDGE